MLREALEGQAQEVAVVQGAALALDGAVPPVDGAGEVHERALQPADAGVGALEDQGSHGLLGVGEEVQGVLGLDERAAGQHDRRLQTVPGVGRGAGLQPGGQGLGGAREVGLVLHALGPLLGHPGVEQGVQRRHGTAGQGAELGVAPLEGHGVEPLGALVGLLGDELGHLGGGHGPVEPAAALSHAGLRGGIERVAEGGEELGVAGVAAHLEEHIGDGAAAQVLLLVVGDHGEGRVDAQLEGRGAQDALAHAVDGGYPGAVHGQGLVVEAAGHELGAHAFADL